MTVMWRPNLVTRGAAWLLSPSKGFSILWSTSLLILGFGVRDASVVSAFLFATFSVGWCCMLMVSALMPPPPKITEISALAARVMAFVRATWATVVFAGGAVYGGLVGAALSSDEGWKSADGSLGDIGGYIWPVVGTVATVAGLYAIFACALDLHRAGGVERARAVNRAVGPIEAVIGAGRLTRWLSNFMLFCIRGWKPWALALIAPFVAASVWSYLAGSPLTR